MTLFFLGIILLAVGYMTYGRFIEKMIAPDDRQTSRINHFFIASTDLNRY